MLRATELTGKDGKALAIKHEPVPSDRELARCVLDILRTANLKEVAPAQRDRVELHNKLRAQRT